MAEATPSDAELVRLAQKASSERAEAFGRLVERHQDYVYGAVCHLIGSGQDAEDIAQDVFVSAYKALDGFEGRARFTTWLYGIMLNSVRSYWRRQKKVTVLSIDPPGNEEGHKMEVAADQDGPAELSVRAERVSVVREAIAGLDEPFREVLVLRDIQGLTYEELAETLDLPGGTVKSRLHRARRELMERLKPYWDAQE